MGRSRYKILNEGYPYFITSSIVNGYNLFSEKRYRDLIVDGLNFMSKQKGIKIYAYVIMSNHIHFISKGKSLSKCIAGFKSFTARQIIDSMIEEGNKHGLSRLKEARVNNKTDREHQLWTEGFHPKLIFSDEVMEQKLSYIHYNPVKAGLVRRESDWIYSSYGDYYGDATGLVNIVVYQG